jgi:pimeloyl-ACP methyl ester carboxylesterase
MEYDNQRLLQEYKKLLLIMVGNNDTVTPPAYARALFESVPEGSKQYREIPSADHMNVIQQSDTKIVYAEFITQLKRVK